MCTSNVCDCAIFRLSEERQCPPTGPFVFICKDACIMGGELQGGEVRQGDRPDCWVRDRKNWVQRENWSIHFPL